jgi:hypothetical protein
MVEEVNSCVDIFVNATMYFHHSKKKKKKQKKQLPLIDPKKCKSMKIIILKKLREE